MDSLVSAVFDPWIASKNYTLLKQQVNLTNYQTYRFR